MAKAILISPIQLYSLIAVRRIRLHYGISAQELAKGIGKSINYIGTMENEQNEGGYNDTVLTEIAQYISAKIKEYPESLLEIKGKMEYSIYDFYPSEILSDEKVVKKIDPIPLGSGPTGTLNALIESTNFFKTAKTLKEIVTKANKVQNQNWEPSNFTQPLENAVKGKNKRLDVILKDGLNTYTLAKKQKKD